MREAMQNGLWRAANVRLTLVLALAVLALLWLKGGVGISAAIGVVLAVATGYVALWRKRQSFRESTQAAMGAVVGVFFLRLVVLIAGVVLLDRWEEGSTVAFIGGFFVAFLTAQFIEVKYLVSASKVDAPRSE